MRALGLTMKLAAVRMIAAYLRATPDHAGRWRLARLAVGWAPALKYLLRPITVRLKDGSRLIVDGSSQTGRIALVTGEYEPLTTALIKTCLRPGDVAVDVGANIGFFSIAAAQSVGAFGRVLAFEPVPHVRASLLENLALNGITSVTVHAEALGPVAQEAAFYLGPTFDTGLGSLRELQDGVPISVDQQRFDDLYDLNKRVSLVKIDVEGGELGVLQGMDECLRRDRPRIVLEVTDDYLRSLGASASELLGFLSTRGYHMWAMIEDDRLSLVRNNCDLRNCPPQFNAFCSTEIDDPIVRQLMN